MRLLATILLPLFALCFLQERAFATTSTEALERYELAELTLVATDTDRKHKCRRPVAYILDRDGYVHSGLVGGYIGRHRGVIAKILRDRIVVSEVDGDQKETFITVRTKKP